MARSTDPEQQTQERHRRGHHGGGTGTDDGPADSSSSSATCNPIRAVSAILDPGQVCSNLGSLMQACSRRYPPGPPVSPPPPPRVYHAWPGKNVFFLDGRVICGPNPVGLILTAMALSLSEWFFLTYVVAGSSTYPTLISVFSLILAITVTATLLLTALRDPGMIPRNKVPPVEEAGTSTGRSTPSRFAMVNGVEMRLKFCRVCNIFRPPRSSHCAVCDNCIDKFDHHSAWISQCIGLRNYRLYLLFVCSALAFYVFIFPFTIIRIRAKLDSVRKGFFGGLIYLPGIYALAVLCLLAICFCGYLLALNAFLVAKNKTSHENHKGQHRNSPNPYDEGTLGNVKECLFEKLPPPRVDFRAVAGPDLESTARTTANAACPPGGACRLAARAGC